MMVLALLIAVQGTGSAMAADPVPSIVYDRPGATPRQVEADLRRCRLITTGPTAAASAERPDGAAWLDNGSRGVAPGESVETCMAMYGWRIHALSERKRRARSRVP